MKISKSELIENILVFIILANTFLGYPYSNILIGIVPLNEVILCVCIFLIWNKIPFIVKKYKLLIPLLIWSLLFLFRAFIDFLTYGIWALRDAMHLVEVWWIFPAIYVADKNNLKNLFSKIYKISVGLIPLKFLFIFSKPYSEIIVVHGVQGEIPLLTSMASLSLIMFFSFFYSLISDKNLFRRIIVFLYFFLYVAIAQSRNIYISLIFILFLYLILQTNLLRFIRMVFVYIPIFLFTLWILSKMNFLDQYTRFGIENVSPLNIARHLKASITGNSLDPRLEGSVAGMAVRLMWYANVLSKLAISLKNFLLGVGFGVPLTDFYASGGKLVREPHNSFVSIFGRTGLIGYILWFSFYLLLMFKLLKNFVKAVKNKINNQIAVIFCVFVYVFFLSMFEAFFEAPFEASFFYIFTGFSLCIVKKN